MDCLLPIFETAEPDTLSIAVCSSPHRPISSYGRRSDTNESSWIQPRSTLSGPLGSSKMSPAHFLSFSSAQCAIPSRQVPPEEAFSDAGLVGGSLPRYTCFRNLTELPPLNTTLNLFNNNSTTCTPVSSLAEETMESSMMLPKLQGLKRSVS